MDEIKAIQEKFDRIDAFATMRYFCRKGQHNVKPEDTYLTPKGKRYCKFHRKEVKNKLKTWHEILYANGKLKLCEKPPTLCPSQFITVNHIAKDKKRLKVFCIEQPFKYCLLEPLKKQLQKT